MSRNPMAQALRSPKYRQRVIPAKNYWEERYGASRRALDEALCADAEAALDGHTTYIAERNVRGWTEVCGFGQLNDARAWARSGAIKEEKV